MSNVSLAGTTAVAVSALLPVNVRRAFPRAVLDTLKLLSKNPVSLAPFDPSGKTVTEVFEAVVKGRYGAAAALVDLNTRMLEVNVNEEIAEAKVNVLARVMDTIKLSIRTKCGGVAAHTIGGGIECVRASWVHD